jgi:hypothetical protein
MDDGTAVAQKTGMRMPLTLRHVAVAGVVVVGAAASIATSSPDTLLGTDLYLPTVQLSETHSVATFHLRVVGNGIVRSTHASLQIITQAERPRGPVLLSARSSVDEDTNAGGATIAVDCDSLPCADDVEVRIELQRRPDGTWSPPSSWTLHANLDLALENRRDLPSDVSIKMELVP